MFAWLAGFCRQMFVAVCMFTWLATCFGSCRRAFVAVCMFMGVQHKIYTGSTKLCIKLLLRLWMSQTSIWGPLLNWNFVATLCKATVWLYHQITDIAGQKSTYGFVMGPPHIYGSWVHYYSSARSDLFYWWVNAIAGQNSLLCSKARIWQPLAVWKVKLPHAKLGMICHANSPLG